MLQRGSRDLQKRGDQPMEQGRRFFSPLEEMDRWFDDAFRRPFLSLLSSRMRPEAEEMFPPVDIFEDGESVVVKAEIPGIKKDDISVEVTQDAITISGKKSSEERVEQKDYFRVERSYGSFTRTLPLPMETMTEKARAAFKDGVLEVRIPKSANAKPRAQKVTVE